MHGRSWTLTLALALMLASTTANAEGWFLEVNGTSLHSQSSYIDGGQSRPFREVNPGIGVVYEHNGWLGAKGGGFHNSYDNLSIYGGVVVRYEQRIGPLTVTPNLTLGAITGYSDTPVGALPIQPMAVPGLAIGTGNVRLNVSYLPGEVHVVGVQLHLRMR